MRASGVFTTVLGGGYNALDALRKKNARIDDITNASGFGRSGAVLDSLRYIEGCVAKSDGNALDVMRALVINTAAVSYGVSDVVSRVREKRRDIENLLSASLCREMGNMRN